MYCNTQFGTVGTIVQASLARVQPNILYYTVWYNRYNRAGESS